MTPIVIKVADMFGGGGMGTSLFYLLSAELTKQFGMPVKVEVVAVIECVKSRCEVYRSLHKSATVIHGDVNNPKDLAAFIKAARDGGAQVLCASPVCRSFSNANNSPGKKAHENNRLFLRVNEVIETCDFFKAILIENVPAFLKARPKNVPELNGLTIGEYELQFLKKHDFNTNSGILDSKWYSVPQSRRRSFVLGIKKSLGEWAFPQKHTHLITENEAIGDLPALEPYADPINPYPIYHRLRRWPQVVVDVLRYTGPGDSAFLNKPGHRLTRKDGLLLTFYSSSIRRGHPDHVRGAILQKSGRSIICHPGRLMGYDKKGEKMFSEVRPYTILELMIFMGMPRDFRFPAWCDDEEDLLRDIIGEGVCPPVMNLLLKQIIPALIKDMQKQKQV